MDNHQPAEVERAVVDLKKTHHWREPATHQLQTTTDGRDGEASYGFHSETLRGTWRARGNVQGTGINYMTA